MQPTTEQFGQVIAEAAEQTNWGVCVYDPDTEAEIYAREADRPMQAASTNKLGIATALETLRINEPNALEEILLVTPDDRRTGTGILQYFPDNYEVSVGDTARLMLSESDTTAAKMLVRHFGGPVLVNRAFIGSKLELESTRLEPVDSERFYFGRTTAEESARMLDWLLQRPTSLYREALHRNHCNYALRGDIDTKTQARTRTLRKLLPFFRQHAPKGVYDAILDDRRPAARFANKEGSLEGNRHDVARIGSLTISAMSEGYDTELPYRPKHPAHRIHRELGKLTLQLQQG